jgi:group I intron endonuclease
MYTDIPILNSGVYLIRCTAVDWVYVGSSKNFQRRWFKEHLAELRKGVHHNLRLQADWNKYGESAFEFEPIIHCSPIKKELRHNEQLAINAHWGDHCYNDNPYAAIPPVIRWRTSEWNANVSKALTGIPLSEAHKESLRAGWKKRKARGLLRNRASYEAQGKKTRGRKQSPEWIEKRAKKLRGREIPLEVRQARSETQKGKSAHPNTAANLRKISALMTDEYRSWLGRKGSALRWNKPFSELEPSIRYNTASILT